LINIKNLELKNLKRNIILIEILLGLFAGIYLLVITPYKKNLTLAMEINSNHQKIKKLSEEKITTEKVLEKSQKISEENNRILENLIIEFKKMTFENLGNFEKYIEDLSTKNKLEISTIGRVEKVQIDQGENLSRILCPYEVTGNEENIHNFLKELESSEYLISIILAPILIEINDESSKITLKISTTMKEKKTAGENIEESVEDYISEEKNLPLSRIMKNIREYRIICLNNIRYIVVHTKNKKKKIFKEKDQIEINNNLYKIKIISAEVYLESIE